jgi:hypothetical protein
LLFDDDLMERQRIEARALHAVALEGLGRGEESRILNEEISKVDPNRMALATVHDSARAKESVEVR